MFYESVGKALRNSDPVARAAALKQLGQVDETSALRMILSHVPKEDEQSNLELIGSLMSQRALGECVDFLRSQIQASDDTEKVRLLFVLGFINHVDVFTMAAEQFGEEEQRVAVAAFNVLRRLGKERVLQLFTSLAHSKESDTRVRAMRALAKFSNAEVVPILHRGLSDGAYDVRKASWDGLQRLQQIGITQAGVILADVIEPPAPGGAPATELGEDFAGEDEEGGYDPNSPRLTGLDKLKAEGKSCRSCVYMKRQRPDKKKMAQTRLWCGLIGKETVGERICARGKWGK